MLLDVKRPTRPHVVQGDDAPGRTGRQVDPGSIKCHGANFGWIPRGKLGGVVVSVPGGAGADVEVDKGSEIGGVGFSGRGGGDAVVPESEEAVLASQGG